jgi:hypothetical protein
MEKKLNSTKTIPAVTAATPIGFVTRYGMTIPIKLAGMVKSSPHFEIPGIDFPAVKPIKIQIFQLGAVSK